jgi:hypothetical protein
MTKETGMNQQAKTNDNICGEYRSAYCNISKKRQFVLLRNENRRKGTILHAWRDANLERIPCQTITSEFF